MIANKALFLFFILFSIKAQAQTVWGIEGAANVSTLGTSSIYKPRLGYAFGTYYAQHLEEQYGWKIGLQYSLLGARDATNTLGRLSYHYLSVPLVLKLYFADNTYAEVGPQIGYLLRAKYHETGISQDRTDVVKKWDIMGLVGLGYETDFGGNVGLRFGYGISNTTGATTGNSLVFRNLLFQFYVGINIKEFGK